MGASPYLMPMRIITALLLLLSAICFGMGISLPIAQFKRLYFFEETPSLLSLFAGLWGEGQVLIALAVLLFSIVFPIVKLTVTFLAALAPDAALSNHPLAKFAPMLAKWSMMDVLLVALVIFAAKSSGLASAIAQPGLWFYASSAISGAVAAGLLKRERVAQEGSRL